MIAYGAKGKLWKVPAEAGTPSVIGELPSGLWDDDAGGAWMPDGTIVYSNGNAGLFQVSAQGGDSVEVLKPDPKKELHFHAASALPGGRGVVYVVHRSGEGTGNNTIGVWSGGKAHYVLEAAGQAVDDAVYSPSGHLLYERSPANAGVWALPFSLADLKATGESFLVSPGTRAPSVASDGTLVVLPPRRQRPVSLVWVDRQGKVVSRIGEPALRRSGAISPDGNRVATSERIDGKADIWIYDVDGGTRRRLTNDGEAGDPEWVGDGHSVVYDSFDTVRRSGSVLKRVLADGSGRVEEIGPGGGGVVSRDGQLFYIVSDQQGWHLWYRSLTDGKEKPAPFLPQAFYNLRPAPSPDGRFVAYEASSGPTNAEIYLRRFPASEGVWQVSTSGGMSPRWSADGRLFFAKGPEIYEASVTADPDVRVSAPTLVFKRTAPSGGGVPSAFDVAPDGKHFLVYELAGETADDRMTVTLNWFAELRAAGGGTTGGADESRRGNEARALRDPRAHRRRRDGRGVQGAGYAPRAYGRGQGASASPVGESGAAPALRARGQDDLADFPPAHLRPLRRQPRGRDRVPRHGIPRGRDAGRPAGQGAAAGRAAAALRHRDRRRARQGPPPGDRPPGPEAGQRDADEVGREAARLRPREVPGGGARRVVGRVAARDRDAGEPAADRARHGPRHVPVHGARAARGQGRRRAERHLRVRRRPLRDGDGQEGVLGLEPGLAHRRDPARRSAGDLGRSRR